MQDLEQLNLRVSKQADGRVRYINVGRVFKLCADGCNDAEILKRLKTTEKAIRAAKGAIIAINPTDAENVLGPAGGPYNLLIDENLPPEIVWTSYAVLGRATHTNYCDLSGKDDFSVYDYAVNNGVDAILTCDKREKKHQDLSIIAVAHAFDQVIDRKFNENGRSENSFTDLPLLIRFERLGKKPDVLRDSLLKHKEEIDFLLQYRITPYVTISEKGLRLGPTMEDIYEKLRRKAQDSYEFRNRIEAWVDGWVQKIINKKGGRKLNSEQMAIIRSRARECAELCFEARGKRNEQLSMSAP